MTFQSTLPRRGATPEHHTNAHQRDFNPRSREGSDPCRYRRSAFHAGFQSTLPRRERLFLRLQRVAVLYFNPRSREGSDTYCAMAAKIHSISIHAPAKGATNVSFSCSGCNSFQSTLPRRERLVRQRRKQSTMLFQSTLPRRSDPTLTRRSCRKHRFQSTLPRRSDCVRFIHTRRW